MVCCNFFDYFDISFDCEIKRKQISLFTSRKKKEKYVRYANSGNRAGPTDSKSDVPLNHSAIETS